MQRNLPICPILQEEMSDPYITSCGHSFQKSAITEWVSSKNTCGVCRQPQTLSQLIPNRELKTCIEQMKSVYETLERMKAQQESLEKTVKLITTSSESKTTLSSERETDLSIRTSLGKRIQEKEKELANKLVARAIQRKRIQKMLSAPTFPSEGKEERKAESLKQTWDHLYLENKTLKKQQTAEVNKITHQMENAITALKKNAFDEKTIDEMSVLAKQLKKVDDAYQQERHNIKKRHANMLTHIKPILTKLFKHRLEKNEIKILSTQLKELREQEIKYSQEQIENKVKKVSISSVLFGGTTAPLSQKKLQELNLAFRQAVANDNVIEARSLLLKGAKVNSAMEQDEKAMPALWTALTKQNEAMIDLLLEHKINLNLKFANSNKWSIREWDFHKGAKNPILIIATVTHHKDSGILEKLIKAGINVNETDCSNFSPLDHAIDNHQAAAILIKNQAVIDIDRMRKFANTVKALEEKTKAYQEFLTLHIRPPATAPIPSI